ncbi:EAL domain-containing protein [uncultured Propionivibrio sp.]|uniref:bifunctional diguanylate cyclase/phosphodiesterase n=1 Tax=uncultured Propionivibrio sp. TaxID=426737 RepID=UPI0029C00F63|nr:EAL domain-containing protein [uncultured Propionivibrio sp.]
MRSRDSALSSLIQLIPFKTISGGLVTLLVILNVAAIFVSLGGATEFHDSSMRNAEIRTQNFALAADIGISSEIRKVDLSLRSVVAGLEEVGPKAASGTANGQGVHGIFNKHRSLLLETEGWNISDADGNIVSSDSAVSPVGLSIADRDYFNELKRDTTERLIISKPIVSRRTGNQVLAFARAIRDPHKKFLGAVIIPLPISYFSEMFSTFNPGIYGYLALRDMDLGLIARSAQNAGRHEIADQQQIGDATVSDELKRLVHSGARQATYHGIRAHDGISHVATFRRIDETPLLVTAFISAKHYLAEWGGSTRRLLGFLAIFLAIGNGTGILLIRLLKQQHGDARLLRKTNEQLENSLRQLRDRDMALIAAQDAGGLGTYTLDIPGGSWSVSSKLREILGIRMHQHLSIDQSWLLVHPDDRESLRRHLHDEVLEQRCMFNREYRIIRADNAEVVWVHSLGKLEFDDRGNPLRLCGTMQDVSRRKVADDRLRLTSEVFQCVTEGIIVMGKDGRIIETNPAFSKITGYSCEEVKGHLSDILNSGAQTPEFYQQRQKTLLEQGLWEGETANQRKDGTRYIQYSRVSAIRNVDGEISHLCSVISDITELKESHRRLEHLAYHDELTGLTNRVLLTDRMRQAMAQCLRRTGELLGVCYLDLDNFKSINDRWGHETGDLVLQKVAERLTLCVRSGDTISRLGGDEFVVMFCQLDRECEIEAAVQRLMHAVSEPLSLDEIRVQVAFSVGVSVFPIDDADEPDVLLRHADQAMYEAKRSGKRRVCFFDPESERRVREHLQMRERLIDALPRHELLLHFQPQVDLRSGRVVGMEALLRWQHPHYGLLMPGEFLPSIEATELTLPLGEWIFHEAIQQQQMLTQRGVCLPVSVNVFTLHLQRADFVARLEAILATYPTFEPSNLELEILETTALENIEDIALRIDDCMRLGVRFSLDDFGTGFSSLTYLRQLSAGAVKIDRSFVRDILNDTEDEALVTGITGLAHTLGRRVIAEGVETLEHGAALLRCGCDCAQGFGIARPMPADGLASWISQWSPPENWRAKADYEETMNA